MSHLPIIREFLKPLRMMEYQMKQAEALLRPSFTYFNLPKIRIEYPHPDETYQESILEDKDKLQVKINVKDFKSENIQIKTLGSSLLIQARHQVEYESDKGFEMKELVRKFVLPKNHDIKNCNSTLSSDGILTITIPKVAEPAKETKIPITHEANESNINN